MGTVNDLDALDVEGAAHAGADAAVGHEGVALERGRGEAAEFDVGVGVAVAGLGVADGGVVFGIETGSGDVVHHHVFDRAGADISHERLGENIRRDRHAREIGVEARDGVGIERTIARIGIRADFEDVERDRVFAVLGRGRRLSGLAHRFFGAD